MASSNKVYMSAILAAAFAHSGFGRFLEPGKVLGKLGICSAEKQVFSNNDFVVASPDFIQFNAQTDDASSL